MSPKPSLGKRHTCHACNTKYYDLNKPDPHCPKCGADPTESSEPDPRVVAMAKLKAESALGRRRAAVGRPPEAEEVETEDTDLDDVSDMGEDEDAEDEDSEWENNFEDDEF